MPLYNNAFHCMEFGVSNCDAKYDVNDVIGDCPTAYELVIRFYKYARNEYQNTMKLHPKK